MTKPGPQIDIVGIDKVEHALMFCVGGTLLGLGLALAGWRSWGKIGAVIIVVGTLVGWGDEWHQQFTPGRVGLDVYDWLADIFGSIVAVPVARRRARSLGIVPEGYPH
jgi:VanZ family protein